MTPALTPPPTPDRAARLALQAHWARRVEPRDRLGPVRWIAGVDVAYPAGTQQVFGGVALLDAHTLEVVETVTSRLPDAAPYEPGLLSFRELPALLACFDRLGRAPDLVVCDGQGLAHPARFGHRRYPGCRRRGATGPHFAPAKRGCGPKRGICAVA